MFIHIHHYVNLLIVMIALTISVLLCVCVVHFFISEALLVVAFAAEYRDLQHLTQTATIVPISKAKLIENVK